MNSSAAAGKMATGNTGSFAITSPNIYNWSRPQFISMFARPASGELFL